MDETKEKAQQIQCVIFDIDGVFTDGRIYLSDTGHEFKAFHAQDGMAIKMLLEAGIEVGIITARESALVQQRMTELGVKYIYQGQFKKIDAYNDIKAKLSLNDQQIAYVGDDLVDLPVIRQCGFGVAVANAVPFVILHADYHTKNQGGSGAVREVTELILEAQDKLVRVHEVFL